MREYPLSFYVDKLEDNDYFSLVRFGDGEFKCMWGKGTQNSNRCLYTPELRDDLVASFHHRHDQSFIFGMQRVLPGDRKRAEELYPVDWHDTEIFSEAVAYGGLYPLIARFRVMNTVVIGNESIRKDVKRIFYNTHFIEVPSSNAHELKKEVLEECRELAPACFLFSCGMAANAFISELHGLENSFLLDLGHIWDPFTGNMSRCGLEGRTKEEIERNLYP